MCLKELRADLLRELEEAKKIAELEADEAAFVAGRFATNEEMDKRRRAYDAAMRRQGW